MSFNGIRLSYSKEKGNHYSANCDLKAKELIFTEKFFFATPLLLNVLKNGKEENISRCANWTCWKIVTQSTGYTCKGCKYSLYCNEDCYNAVKFYHMKICDISILENYLALAALYFATGAIIPSLEILSYGIPNKEYRLKILRFVKVMQIKFPDIPVRKLIIDTTRFHFISIQMKTFFGEYIYANAFFLFANYFNHSCEPNCYFYFANDKIHVKTIRDIYKDEQLTFSYDHELLYTSAELRKESLVHHLGNNCNCPRCTDEIKIANEKKLFETMKGKPNRLITLAVSELFKDYKKSTNLDVLIQLETVYQNHFELTHSMGYELFKKYTTHLWESSKLVDGITFCKRLIQIMESWKKNNIDTMRLENWCKIMFFILISYTIYIPGKEEKKALKYDYNNLSLHMISCQEAIDNCFNWEAFEMDKAIYPFLTEILELANNAIEIVTENISQ